MIRIEFDARAADRSLAEVDDQLPFAASLALNKTAQKVKKELVSEMKRVFDRPTPFVLNSLYIKPATKQKLEAMVWLKDEYSVGSVGTPATKYLSPEIFGGGRNAKSHERRLRDKGLLGSNRVAVPGRDAVLNRYGNFNGGTIKQMMSGLGINRDIGYQSNATAKSRRRNRKRANYFVMGGERPMGIFSRAAGGEPKSFIWFVKAPHYRSRLDFFGIGQRVIDEHLAREMDAAIELALRTARFAIG